MESKERMVRALAGEKPDRLPVTFHQWQSYHLETYLKGVSPLEAFDIFGMDASVQYFQPMDLRTPNWRIEEKVLVSKPENKMVRHWVTTPEGELTFTICRNQQTAWITEYLIKKDEDIQLIKKYMPLERLDVQAVNRAYDQVGDKGILRGYVWGNQAGCWQHAACLMDPQDLILAAFDKPDWVHELLGILNQKKLDFISSMKGARFDLVETGGGASSSTLISPDFHEKFCLPYDLEQHTALKNLGFHPAYHTCGGTKGIEDLILKNGCLTSETLAPKSIGGNNEPWEFKEKVGHNLALIGGLDQFNVLTTGSEEQIRGAVFTLFEKVGYGGGYILSTADHFFKTPVENIKTYAKAARECVY